MYEVTIYLKSGTSFTVYVTDMKTKRGEIDNSLMGLEWAAPEDTASLTYNRLNYVRLGDIVAITQRRMLIETDEAKTYRMKPSAALPIAEMKPKAKHTTGAKTHHGT